MVVSHLRSTWCGCAKAQATNHILTVAHKTGCLDMHHTTEHVKSAHLHKLCEHCQTMVQTEATYIHPARIELATFSVLG